MSVCPSVCPSHSRVAPKRFNVSKHFCAARCSDVSIVAPLRQIFWCWMYGFTRDECIKQRGIRFLRTNVIFCTKQAWYRSWVRFLTGRRPMWSFFSWGSRQFATIALRKSAPVLTYVWIAVSFRQVCTVKWKRMNGHYLVVHVTNENVVCRRHVLFAGALRTSGPGTCCDVIADHRRRHRCVESTASGAQLWVARAERRESAYTTTSPIIHAMATIGLHHSWQRYCRCGFGNEQ